MIADTLIEDVGPENRMIVWPPMFINSALVNHVVAAVGHSLAASRTAEDLGFSIAVSAEVHEVNIEEK